MAFRVIVRVGDSIGFSESRAFATREDAETLARETGGVVIEEAPFAGCGACGEDFSATLWCCPYCGAEVQE